MTTEREALIKQLQEGQTYDFSTGDPLDMSSIMDDAANMLEATPQPEQEPVARFDANDLIESLGTVTFLAHQGQQLKNGDRLYTTPPKRKEWVGLTLVEVNEIEKNGDFWEDHTPFDFFQAIEAKLKEKNA